MKIMISKKRILQKIWPLLYLTLLRECMVNYLSSASMLSCSTRSCSEKSFNAVATC